MTRLCIRCGGSGNYLGNGMIMTNCELCDDDEIYPAKKYAPSLNKIDRRSKSYRDALKEIRKVNPDINADEAVRLFDEAYVKE
jgi:predicted  nucleic acid-binding Zn-ribbon protein